MIILNFVSCYRDDDSTAGRCPIDVSREDIVSLRKLNYTWTKIARMLGISRKTLYRRLEEYNIPSTDYSSLSSNELDEVVKSIKRDFPNDGEVMLQGHISRLGFKIQRAELRASIHRVDHDNTVLRRSCAIKCRVYSVPRPNTVWHLDGNHKLIRWRLVIHAGVDGFSRMIVFVKYSDNNRASTMLESFLEGASSFGLPSHVRTDHGGENVDVWRHMLSNSNDPLSVITGSSTHNQRVERMWRDMRRSVSSSFSTTFTEIETEGVLDPLNDVDMFCLHYIYLPRINRNLQEFQESWNRHSMSTEGSMSPCQMFFESLSGIEDDNGSNATSNTGSSSAGDIGTTERVEIPRISFLPCSNLLTQLQAIQPLSMTTDFGKSLYYIAIQIVGRHLQTGCVNCISQ